MTTSPEKQVETIQNQLNTLPLHRNVHVHVHVYDRVNAAGIKSRTYVQSVCVN